VLFDFYDQRVPQHVVGGAELDAWWKKQRHETPRLLHLSLEDLVRGDVDPGEHPDVWVSGDLRLPLSYSFEPGTATDGVTVEVPVAVLNRVSAEDLAWQVPGMRHELVTALIKTLPKPLRVKLVPAPDTARQLLERVSPREEHLLHALSREARALRGVVVPVEEWGLDRVPEHLRPTYQVVGQDGQVLATGKDLQALRAALVQPARAAVASAAGDLERRGLTSWTVGTVPERVSSGAVVGHPALVDRGTSVDLLVLPEPDPAAHRAGVRRLLLLGAGSPVKQVSARLDNRAKLALTANPHGSLSALMEDCLSAAVDSLVPADARDERAFQEQLDVVRVGLPDALLGVLRGVERVLRLSADVTHALQAQTHPASAPAVADVRQQLQGLVHPGFVTEVGAARLPDLERYLQAALVRLERLPREAARDQALQSDVEVATGEWRQLPPGAVRERVRWMVEELRVSLFAPAVKAKGPVSLQRIYKLVDAS
jgi:ATP-dependent helicase HrpA